jgi:sugar (pentulose or hexulose) kinase
VTEFFLGIDFGTSGARACVIDATGKAVHQDRVAYRDPLSQTPEDWQDALFQLLSGLPEQAKSSLATIAIDGTSGTVLLTDETGVPVGPALLYADNRAALEASDIATRPGLHGMAAPASGLASLLWLLKRYGTKGACHACHQADWLTGQLCGRFDVADYHNALKSGYDIGALAWPEWLTEFGIFPLLPSVVTPGETIGQILPQVARRYQLNPACLVRAGTTDSIAAFMAAGVNRPGEAVTSLGTTMVLKLLSRARVDMPQSGVYSHRYGDAWLAGGASNTGGGVLRKFFSDEQLASLSDAIDTKQPSGLDYYPLPGPGERFPVNDAGLQPRLEPRPENDVDFLHGLLESMARIEALGYRKLMELGADPLRLVKTAGGGAANKTWMRIRQQQLGVPVSVATHGDAAYGAARLACYGSSMLANVEQ